MYAVIIALVLIIWLEVMFRWLKKNYPKYIRISSRLFGWKVAMIVSSILAIIAIYTAPSPRLGNFLYHLIGGGVIGGIAIIATISTLKKRLSPLQICIVVFSFISSLGVLNELLEFAIENLGFVIFTYDRHDTWRDLLANTLGGLVVSFIYILMCYAFDQRQKADRSQG